MSSSKPNLIIDNDGTLTRFKNGNFRSTVADSLQKNIRSFIGERLGFSDSEIDTYHADWSREGISLSAGYEGLGIPRSEYLHKTWNNLDPKNFLEKSDEKGLHNLILSKKFSTHLITSAPRVWYQKTIGLGGITEENYDTVTTGESFDKKTNYISELLQKIPRNRQIVAVGDQPIDIISVIEMGNIGIRIGSSGSEKLLQILLDTDPECVSMIGGGATGSLLYRITNNKSVLKMPGFGENSKQEVQGNITGYKTLEKLGGNVLLPSSLEFGHDHIEMSDLGKDLTQLITNQEITPAEAIGKVREAIHQLIINNPFQEGVEEWAEDIIDRIKGYKEAFIQLGYIDEGSFDTLIKQFANKCTSYGGKYIQQHIMPLDFTADNIFIENGKPKFIDPWYQKSYVGFTNVSFAQFLTLLWIYEQIDTEIYSKELERVNEEFSPLFGFDSKEKFSQVTNLGVILQCILSAKHRATRKLEQSKFLFQKAVSLIDQFNNA